MMYLLPFAVFLFNVGVTHTRVQCPSNSRWIQCKNPCREFCDQKPPDHNICELAPCPVGTEGDCECYNGYAEPPFKPRRCIPKVNVTTVINCVPYAKRDIVCPKNSHFTRCMDPCRRICGKKVRKNQNCSCDHTNMDNHGCQCNDGFFEDPYSPYPTPNFACFKPVNGICHKYYLLGLHTPGVYGRLPYPEQEPYLQ